MKRLLLSIFLLVVLDTLGGESPPRLVPIGRSKTAPIHSLQFPTDESDFAAARQLNDDMQLLAVQKSKPRIERALTPDTLKLLRLDPNLGHNINENVKRLKCQATILEGIQMFDESQAQYLELEATPSQTSNHYEDLTAIEERQLEALCIFVSAHKKGCWEAYPIIASVHRSIMNLESKRKTINPYYTGIHPKYGEKKFLKEIREINSREAEHKKDMRQSLSLAPDSVPAVDSSKSVVDLNNSGELRTQAMTVLQTADTFAKRVIFDPPNMNITHLEYQQAENLYCLGIMAAIRSFHTQPKHEEKQVIFEDIQKTLRKVQHLQRCQREKGFTLEISDEYAAICKFFEDQRTKYEIPEGETVKVSWARTLRETKDTPPHTPHGAPLPRPPAQEKSRLRRFFECVTPCIKR